ncbi:MAG TPA: M3 family oligoendopeptidase [Candidatus Nitrosopelagicus sp.]|nr:M3 family oligoendopeptidase [Candidatus Nitrosopelagicus sp.]
MNKYEKGKWDLDDLVKNPTRQSFDKKINEIQKQSDKFVKIRSQLKPDISSKKFLAILHEIEDITEKASKIGGYAGLKFSENTQSDEATTLLNRISQFGSVIQNKMLFFDLWWKKQVDEKNAKRLIKESGDLSDYLRYKRLVAKYALSEPEEKIINTLDVTGISALVKIYDKITNAFSYTVNVNGKKKTLGREELTTLVRNKNPRTREAAYKALLTKYQENKGVIGQIYQNIALNWKNEGMDMRKFPSPISIQNISNDVDDKTIDVMLQVCKKNATVFQKYFKQKAKRVGVKKLRRYDLYAPSKKSGAERNYTFDQGAKLVLDSLNRFSPKIAEFASRVFNENHIDYSLRHGKRDGAFCSTPLPYITPFVLINYTGKSRDVFTLAHEIGHAVHSIAASDKSILVSDAPLPLAETASTYSELLLYDNISNQISDNEKATMLSDKIDDFYATIGRQSFFTLFEMEAHKQIANSITVEDISNIYRKNLKDQFGNSIQISDDFGIEWSCIPHFYHSPFYCYSYSFGNLLAVSLFQTYKNEGESFVSDYIDILSAGGSQKPEILLKEHGLDITKSKFWQDGFDYINEQVNTLSKL